MKTKEHQAEFKSLNEVLDEAVTVMNKIKEGKKVSPKKGISFEY